MKISKPIYVLDGPNLRMLGSREPHIYGRVTWPDLAARIATHAGRIGCPLVHGQSDREDDRLAWIAEADDCGRGIVFNDGGLDAGGVDAGGLTFTSEALADAPGNATVPAIEAHLANRHRRERFGHASRLSGAIAGVVGGFGVRSYLMAIDAMADLIADLAGRDTRAAGGEQADGRAA